MARVILISQFFRLVIFFFLNGQKKASQVARNQRNRGSLPFFALLFVIHCEVPRQESVISLFSLVPQNWTLSLSSQLLPQYLIPLPLLPGLPPLPIHCLLLVSSSSTQALPWGSKTTLTLSNLSQKLKQLVFIKASSAAWSAGKQHSEGVFLKGINDR